MNPNWLCTVGTSIAHTDQNARVPSTTSLPLRDSRNCKWSLAPASPFASFCSATGAAYA